MTVFITKGDLHEAGSLAISKRAYQVPARLPTFPL